MQDFFDSDINPETISDWRVPAAPPVDVPVEALRQTPFRCAHSDLLYPSNPLQLGKTYHLAQDGMFDRRSIDGADPECEISTVRQPNWRPARQREVLERHFSRPGGPRRVNCAQAATLVLRVLSYVYVDECGNLYRGVWTVRFTTPDQDSYLWARGTATLRVGGENAYQKYDCNPLPRLRFHCGGPPR